MNNEIIQKLLNTNTRYTFVLLSMFYNIYELFYKRLMNRILDDK
jgi:hypothetical protein